MGRSGEVRVQAAQENSGQGDFPGAGLQLPRETGQLEMFRLSHHRVSISLFFLFFFF